MAEKYKASHNNEEEVSPEQLEDERSDENNAKAAKAAVKVAKNIPIPQVKAIATAVDKIDDATGGMVTQQAGKAMTAVNKNAPGGKQMQNKINQMGESGATDTVANVADAKSGGGKAAVSGNKSSSFKSNTSSSSSSGGSFISNNMMGNIGTSLKIKIAIGAGIGFMFLFAIVGLVSGKDNENLSMTSEEPQYGGYLGDVNTCSLQVVDGVYYKTLVPQTVDCVVSGFYDDNEWGLEPSFYSNVMALIQDANANGCNAVIISGHRSYEKQQSLYEKYRNQPGRAAVPGYSNHEYGIAADLQFIPHSSTCVSYYHNNANNFGVTFPLVHASFPEDWHIEPINIVKGTP